MRIDKVSLLKLDRHEDVRRGRESEDEMRQCHRRRGPESKQPAEVQRVTYVTIKHRCPELELRVLPADQIQVDLPESKEIEVIDQKCAAQHEHPTRGAETEENHLHYWLFDVPHDTTDWSPLPEQEQ